MNKIEEFVTFEILDAKYNTYSKRLNGQFQMGKFIDYVTNGSNKNKEEKAKKDLLIMFKEAIIDLAKELELEDD